MYPIKNVLKDPLGPIFWIIFIAVIIFIAAIGYWVSLEAALALASIPASILIARLYGDVAGNNAAIEYEERKEKEARLIAIHALLNGLGIIERIAHQNAEVAIGTRGNTPMLKMPVTALETAFLSKESRLLREYDEESTPLLTSVRNYLTEAYSINLLVERYLALTRGLSSKEENWRVDIVRDIQERSKKILRDLPTIRESLKAEIG